MKLKNLLSVMVMACVAFSPVMITSCDDDDDNGADPNGGDDPSQITGQGYELDVTGDYERTLSDDLALIIVDELDHEDFDPANDAFLHVNLMDQDTETSDHSVDLNFVNKDADDIDEGTYSTMTFTMQDEEVNTGVFIAYSGGEAETFGMHSTGNGHVEVTERGDDYIEGTLVDVELESGDLAEDINTIIVNGDFHAVDPE